MLKIFNVRAGFANNSSSTHSIIFLKNPPIDIEDSYEDSFGWEFFTVASKSGILDYLNATLRENFSLNLFNKNYISAIANAWTHEVDDELYVDHQSCIMFPLQFDRSGIDKRYFDAIKEVMLNNNTVILGSNDNDEERHPLSELEDNNDVMVLHTQDNPYWVCKYDDVYDYWTLFNYDNGTKFRIVIDQTGEREIMPEKASTPDIVDMKITNYCTFGCNFCYQGSTKDGKHADTDHIKEVIDVLARKQVYELAVAGGEGTQHPDFIEILEYIKKKHIVPNFTTKNLKWLTENFMKIKDTIGSCAFSVSHVTEIKKLAALKTLYEIPYNKLCVQYVMDSQSDYILKSIIEECSKSGIPLTLLGFKTIGRGEKYRRNDNSKWLDIIRECRENGFRGNIGIDTALVQQYPDTLKEFPNWIYHADEGKFSWYVDCVEKKMGISSYDETLPYDNFRTDFENRYGKD